MARPTAPLFVLAVLTAATAPVAACATSSTDPLSQPSAGAGGDASGDPPELTPEQAAKNQLPDAATDAAPTADAGGANDAGKAGETCIGAGKSASCGAANSRPDYGYVCFGGAPPGIGGCVLASSSKLVGDTYCCTQLACVAEPDQDAKACKNAKTPHRFQCAADGANALLTQPSAGCVEDTAGALPGSRFYCCP